MVLPKKCIATAFFLLVTFIANLVRRDWRSGEIEEHQNVSYRRESFLRVSSWFPAFSKGTDGVSLAPASNAGAPSWHHCSELWYLERRKIPWERGTLFSLPHYPRAHLQRPCTILFLFTSFNSVDTAVKKICSIGDKKGKRTVKLLIFYKWMINNAQLSM